MSELNFDEEDKVSKISKRQTLLSPEWNIDDEFSDPYEYSSLNKQN